MRCEEFEDRLNAVLDERRRAESDPEISSHCQQCPSCRQLAAAYDNALDGFYVMSKPAIPADLALRVMAEMRPRPVSVRRWSLVAAALVTAAGLAIATVPLKHESATRPAQAPLTAPAMIRSIVSFSKLPSLAPLAALRSDDPYRDLARGTGRGLASVVLSTPNVSVGGMTTAAVWNVATYDPVWSTPVTDGLKPVAEGVSETLTVLKQVMPIGQLADGSK